MGNGMSYIQGIELRKRFEDVGAGVVLSEDPDEQPMSKTRMPRLCVACTRGKRKLDECDGGEGGVAEQTRPFTPTAGMIRE
eukprot:3039446-Rhodomonas_salina.1